MGVSAGCRGVASRPAGRNPAPGARTTRDGPFREEPLGRRRRGLSRRVRTRQPGGLGQGGRGSPSGGPKPAPALWGRARPGAFPAVTSRAGPAGLCGAAAPRRREGTGRAPASPAVLPRPRRCRRPAPGAASADRPRGEGRTRTAAASFRLGRRDRADSREDEALRTARPEHPSGRGRGPDRRAGPALGAGGSEAPVPTAPRRAAVRVGEAERVPRPAGSG